MIRNSLSLLLIIVGMTLASGGDTIKYTTAVKDLANGDRFYADLHWKSLQDSIARVVNGRLGNVNISSTALIDAAKFDTTKTIVMRNGRIDTIIIKTGTVDTAFIRAVKISVLDSVYLGKGIKIERSTIDTIRSDTAHILALKVAQLDSTYMNHGFKVERGTIDTIRGDTIFATAAKISRFDSIYIQTGLNVPRIDSTAFVKGVYHRRARTDTVTNKWISGDTAYFRALKAANIDSLYSAKGLNVPRIDSTAFTKGVYHRRTRSDTITNLFITGDTAYFRALKITNVDSFYNIKGYYSKRATIDTLTSRKITSDSIRSRTINSDTTKAFSLIATDKIYADTLFTRKKLGFHIIDSSSPQICLRSTAATYASYLRPYSKKAGGSEMAFAFQATNLYSGDNDLAGLYFMTDDAYNTGRIYIATLRNGVGFGALRINSYGKTAFGNFDATYQLDCRNMASIDSLDVDTLYSDAAKIPRLRADSVTNLFITGDTAYFRALRVVNVDSFYNTKGYYSKHARIDTIRSCDSAAITALKTHRTDSLHIQTGLKTPRIDTTAFTTGVYHRRARTDTVTNKWISGDTAYFRALKIVNVDSFYNIKGYYSKRATIDTLTSRKITSDSLIASTGLRVGSSTIRIGGDSIYSLASRSQRAKIDSLALGFGNAKICTYAETTWVDSTMGLLTNREVTIYATKIGNKITMYLNPTYLTQTPDGGDSLRIKGRLPNKLFPKGAIYIPCQVYDSTDVNFLGSCFIDNSGYITFTSGYSYGFLNNFVGRSDRGFAGFSASYIANTNTW